MARHEERVPGMLTHRRHGLVDSVAGVEADIEVHQDDPIFGRRTEPVAELCGRVAAKALRELRVDDETLRMFGAAVAEAAIRQFLVESDGFTARLGDPSNPVTVDVDLTRTQPAALEPALTRTTGEQ